MKQAIWRGKEIRKEQSDGILELALFSHKHLQSFVYMVFTRERLPDGMAYAIVAIANRVTPEPCQYQEQKAKEKTQIFRFGFSLAPSKHNFLNS